MEKILGAIADKSRWKILKKLEKGSICACKLPQYVGITQPAVSQHLKILREARLVNIRLDGVKRIYSLSDKGRKVVSDVSGWRA